MTSYSHVDRYRFEDMKEGTDKQHKEDMFVQEVLSHYNNNGRHDLVWRKHITPYRILVSEVMLQQTQVGRVLPKFEMWMARYPNLTALGHANLKDILILWQGLGYQRRAKALYHIAKTEKIIPRKYEELLTLVGVGSYTASAICAFAYDTFSHPVLETNIRTALINYFYKEQEKIHDKELHALLNRLALHISVKRVGARTWYYALMDYGAYLKQIKVSHNTKSTHYSKQSRYKGSVRELRAKILFAVVHKDPLPVDARTGDVIAKLVEEEYILEKNGMYSIR
jgi:A/G-specific adenine glycosylase